MGKGSIIIVVIVFNGKPIVLSDWEDESGEPKVWGSFDEAQAALKATPSGAALWVASSVVMLDAEYGETRIFR